MQRATTRKQIKFGNKQHENLRQQKYRAATGEQEGKKEKVGQRHEK